VAAEVDAGAVPLLPGARKLAAEGVATGGAARNRAFAAELAEVSPLAAPEVVDLLFDPQTSGGLLLAAAPAIADALERELEDRGVPRWRVGRLSDGPPGTIRVVA
jgi:selenide,water dikinase